MGRFMLSKPAGEAAVNPLVVKPGDRVKDLRKLTGRGLPIFVRGGGVAVVNREDLRAAPGSETAGGLARSAEPAPRDTPLHEIARLMLEAGTDSWPVAGPDLLGVTEEAVIRAVKSTGALSKREARTVMVPAEPVKCAGESGEVLPVVNDSGKLTGVSVSGEVRPPSMVRLHTRVGVVADKVLDGPLVVVDKHREPHGTITRRDVLELAASLQDYGLPVFYSGLEGAPAGKVREAVASALARVEKVTAVNYASFRLEERGAWSARIKVSTPLRTFVSRAEAEGPLGATESALKRLVGEVVADKEERLKWRLV
jgi:CBS domain-containing protein